jgi:hypothetical protein
VPYLSDADPIASCTAATAQSAGWIWDIGLPNRRGVGYVCSSDHVTQETAERELHNYVQASLDEEIANQLSIRRISFDPGHRETFWQHNCVAIGLSAGFVEPLEASALVLIEKSAAMIAEQMPANRHAMTLLADRFNRRFSSHWHSIVRFLKLHYVLSKRDRSDYWRAHRAVDSSPEDLAESLLLWQHQSPWLYDAPMYDELFPAASYQYVLYGMGFKSDYPTIKRRSEEYEKAAAEKIFQDNKLKVAKLLKVMPSNRDLINKVGESGFQKI